MASLEELKLNDIFAQNELSSLTDRVTLLEESISNHSHDGRTSNTISGTMRSANFKFGVNGWQIRDNGDVEFNQGVFRGNVDINSLDIPDSTNPLSWHVDTTGNMWWGNSPTFGGATNSISNSGQAVLTGAVITGDIIANTLTAQTSGNIAGWNISFTQLTSNNVVISSNGRISSGQTAYNTGIGWWLESQSNGRFSIGDSSGTNLTWNGIVLEVHGTIVSQAGFIGGWNIGPTTLTGGSVTISSAGRISAGQSAWDSGTGWWLESSFGGRLSIGSSGGNRLTWDGSNLFIGVTTEGGLTMRMPGGSGNSSSGFVMQDSGGTPRLKINNNAFISSFQRSFSAASNTSGNFGNDWFQFFCEPDGVPGINSGVIELPNTNGMLIKRSGSGAIIRIRSTNSNGDGKIDLFEPLTFRTRANASGHSASANKGQMYFDTTQTDIVFSNGVQWYKVTATAIPISGSYPG